ncbi:transposase (plasmid) [Lysinibacillus capsici]|nr:transposase [Lysinibacillus capsici]
MQTLECRVSRTQVLSSIWNGFTSLNEEKQLLLKRCTTIFPDLLQIEKIIQDYRNLFQTKDVNGLIVWMKKQLSNKRSPLHSHSIGIRIDLAAVKNAITSPYSNGLLEGQVNRLKWIKRMMYGRAKPDLLEKRMQYRFE